MSFKANLQTGRIGEGEIANWLIGRGYSVLPAYEIEVQTGKGPRVYTPSGGLISPDLLAFHKGKTIWFEAKTKSAFTWHRNSNTWQTGIDLRHWNDYLKVAEITPFDVWLLFLHREGNLAKDTPEEVGIPPSGLFGNDIQILKEKIDHTSDKHGKSGMVYWKRGDLRLLAPINVVSFSAQ